MEAGFACGSNVPHASDEYCWLSHTLSGCWRHYQGSHGPASHSSEIWSLWDDMITYLWAFLTHNPSVLADWNKIAGKVITGVIAQDCPESDNSGSELPTAIVHFNTMSSYTEEAHPCCVDSPCIGHDRYLARHILANNEICGQWSRIKSVTYLKHCLDLIH